VRGGIYRLESLDFRGLLEIVEAILHVVHGHSSVDAVEARVGDLGHAFVCTVSGFEVAGSSLAVFLRIGYQSSLQNGCPVVGEIFAKLA